MSYYKADKVREAASGNWPHIISMLAPQADEALKKPGKHVRCPVHVGKDGDGFRIFPKDFLQSGGGICNTCGPRHDGFELLMWLNDWDFKQTLEAVGELLGVEKEVSKRRQNNSYAQARHKVTACGHSVASAAPEPAVSEPEEKVIPMLREQTKPWLEEAQKKMERQAEQMRRAGAMAKESIARIWERECLPMSSESTEPMRAYFQSRELIFRWNKVEQSDSMRFHPALPFYDKDGKKTGEHPAIVCAIRDKEGQLVTLHRIYLSPKGGKARVAEPKKMMPVPDDLEVTGCAIRLVEPSEGILGIAEGVETALAAYRASQIPVWATVNATLMERFVVPEGVHTVLVWADKDKSITGERSANILKARLEQQGIRVIVLIPQLPIPARKKSVDWNDVLMSQGGFGFPDARHIRNAVLGRYANVCA